VQLNKRVKMANYTVANFLMCMYQNYDSWLAVDELIATINE